MDWNSELAGKTADAIRILSAEAVERAGSGHPGMPMGTADLALVLFAGHLVFNPADPGWPDRDRFILSAGHGSMLLYSLLHLFGYDLSLEDIKSFRQWSSRTPGHPERGHTPGVETTTGPLGQGLANGVGMALARELLAARLNTGRFPVVSHRVFGLVSDGDLMEGVSAEAASLAGHLGLGCITYLYDDNQVTIEGSRDLSFSEDVAGRFQAQGWQVIKCDGHDRPAVDAALCQAAAETSRPSLVMARTRIGFGCPTKAGSADTHGAPIGKDELAGARQCLAWDEPEFTLPSTVVDFCRGFLAPKLAAHQKWLKMMETYEKEEPERASLYRAWQSGELPAGLEQKLLAALDGKAKATRGHSGAALQVIAREAPWVFGGSADLAPSNNTAIKGQASIKKGDFTGRNLHFGIREHAMGGILNGLALSGLIPYGGTFLIFSDYLRPSIRLAALMSLRVIYVFTHDSIFVGEDGPTHQPVEQVASLRAIPNLHVVRPADGPETMIAWSEALNRRGPTALILSRQTLPVLDRSRYAPAEGAKKGAYVIATEDPGRPADLILIATGSEVGLALDVAGALKEQGLNPRVVSMPCQEKFAEQPGAWQEEVLPVTISRRVVLEAGVSFGWARYAGPGGLILGVDRFGASAPYKVLAEKFGFTKPAALELIRCAFPELFPAPKR